MFQTIQPTKAKISAPPNEAVSQVISTPPQAGNTPTNVQPPPPIIPLKEVKNSAKFNLHLTASVYGVLLFWLLSGFFMLANTLIAFRVKSKTAYLTEAKTTYQTQELLAKAGLNQDSLTELENLNTYFLTKEKALAFVNFLNRQTPLFKSLDYNFVGDEPAVSGQKYLPMVISAVGQEANTRELLENIIGLQESIEIIEFTLATDPKTKQSSLTLKLNIYVRDDFAF